MLAPFSGRYGTSINVTIVIEQLMMHRYGAQWRVEVIVKAGAEIRRLQRRVPKQRRIGASSCAPQRFHIVEYNTNVKYDRFYRRLKFYSSTFTSRKLLSCVSVTTSRFAGGELRSKRALTCESGFIIFP